MQNDDEDYKKFADRFKKMSEPPTSDLKQSSVREASELDLGYLPEIEAKADAVFAQIGLTNLPAPATKAELKVARAILVAGDPPIGYARIEEIDGLAHLEQLSVLPEQSGKGVGRQLLEEVCVWAAKRNYPAVTLSTFRDIKWNAPFYANHGFKIIDELTPGLLALRKHEAELGLHDIGPRVIMELTLSGSRQVG